MQTSSAEKNNFPEKSYLCNALVEGAASANERPPSLHGTVFAECLLPAHPLRKKPPGPRRYDLLRKLNDLT